MTDSMVERVARAIQDECRGNWNIGLLSEEDSRSLARAAIAAMREPTEAMLNGARDWSVKKYGIGVGHDDSTGCYQAMIDAALEEPK